MDEVIGEGFLGHDVAGTRGTTSYYVICDVPTGFAAIAGRPVAEVFAVKENDCGFWWCLCHEFSFRMLCVKITIFHYFKEICFFVKGYLAVGCQPSVNWLSVSISGQSSVDEVL